MERTKLISILAIFLYQFSLLQAGSSSPSRRSISANPSYPQKGPTYVAYNSVPQVSYQPQQSNVAPQPQQYQGQSGSVASASSNGFATGQSQTSFNSAPSASSSVDTGAQSQQVGSQQGESSSSAVSSFSGSSGGSDFNPALLGGVPGSAGIKARINRKAFDFAGKLIGPLLDKQIRGAQIPDIHSCLPQLNGCVHITNVRITSYQCPQRIVAYPSPPNLIVLQVENLDIGATANLNGQVVILTPLALVGQLRITAQRISLRVSLAIENQQGGSPSIRVAGCRATIGIANVIVDNGGLLGDIANTNLQNKFSQALRKVLPSQLCGRIPSIVNEQLSGKLNGLPQRISLMQLLGAALSSVGGVESLLGLADDSSSDSATGSSSSAGQCGASSCSRALQARKKTVAGVSLSQQAPVKSKSVRVSRQMTAKKTLPVRATKHVMSTAVQRRFVRQDAGNDTNGCGGCPVKDQSSSISDFVSIAQTLDISKLSDVYLNVQLLRSEATNNDFTLELRGDFTSDAFPTNPFSAFPMSFPQPVGNKMVEGLISDWTINTLLYQLHKVGFLSLKLGPDTPKIGALLKTTCSDDEDSEGSGLEDHGVETEAPSGDATTPAAATSDEPVMKRKLRASKISLWDKLRGKRQDDSDSGSGGGTSLADLGFCLGDILPGIRDQYPNEKLNVQVSTQRAPSVIFKNGGRATLEAIANADFSVQSSGKKVGTIQVTATVDLTITYTNGKLNADVNITELQLKEIGSSLGLPQDALDNLANLAKELLSKQGADNPLFSAKEGILNIANGALGSGKELTLPSGLGLPINLPPITLVDPEIVIVDHALWLATDISISQQALSQAGLADDGSCPRRRRRA